MMRRWLCGLLLAGLSVVWAQPVPGGAAAAPADQVEAGVAALQRGHHAIALRAFRADAERGNPLAQTNMGYMYEHGLGVGQSYVQAMAWYNKAAAQRQPQAQYNLGTLYFHGHGVERNLREALNWFRLAAQQQLPQAQYMYGLAFYEGHGTPSNAALGLDWLLKAALQGHADAQMMAAVVYLSGDAGEAAPDKAYVWADLAVHNGNQDAGLVRDYASYRLSNRQLPAVQQQARRCLQSAYRDCPPR